MSWSPLVEQFQAEWSLLTAFIINIVGKYLSSDVMQVRDHPDGWILSRGKRKILTLGVKTFSLMVWLPNTYPYWLKNDFLSSIFIVHCTYKCMKLIFLANLQFKLTFTLCMGIHCSSLFFSNELFCADPLLFIFTIHGSHNSIYNVFSAAFEWILGACLLQIINPYLIWVLQAYKILSVDKYSLLQLVLNGFVL